MDILSVFLAANLDSELITEGSAGKIAAITDIVSSRLNLLIEWIQSPVYAPNHPVGQEMMNESKTEFEKLERSELIATIEALKAENERLRK